MFTSNSHVAIFYVIKHTNNEIWLFKAAVDTKLNTAYIYRAEQVQTQQWRSSYTYLSHTLVRLNVILLRFFKDLYSSLYL